jgi:hypothetical protein
MKCFMVAPAGVGSSDASITARPRSPRVQSEESRRSSTRRASSATTSPRDVCAAAGARLSAPFGLKMTS